MFFQVDLDFEQVGQSIFQKNSSSWLSDGELQAFAASTARDSRPGSVDGNERMVLPNFQQLARDATPLKNWG